MMNRLDPELVAPLNGFLEFMQGGFNLQDIPAARNKVTSALNANAMEIPKIEGVHSDHRQIPGSKGHPDVSIRISQPTNRPAELPAMLWIHGSGYVFDGTAKDDMLADHLAKVLQCLVISVNYRLAPEHPFPAPLEDCYTALNYIHTNSTTLGVDQTRIAVVGESAGGGLATGLTLLARDRGEISIAYQFLIAPMLDDRNVAPASETHPDTLLWTRENNLIGWRSYLGQEPGGESVSPYAAAARANDFSNLPPTYIAVGELDLFLDESIEYAHHLLQAGIATELHIYPGAPHGFDIWAPTSTVAQRFISERDEVLRRELHNR